MSDDAIAQIMRTAGVTHRPYTAAAFGYYFELDALNGKIFGNHRLSELNKFAEYLQSLNQEERETLAQFAERSTRLTPAQCMNEIPIYYEYDDREFTVVLMPEEYHSVPSTGILHLPATDIELIDAIDRARTDGTPSFIEVRSMSRPYLHSCIEETPDLYELNYLARQLDKMCYPENLLFEALVKIEKPESVAQLISLTLSPEHCVIADAPDYDALGRFAVENSFFADCDNLSDRILSMLDYESLGLEFHKEQRGVFVEGKYIVSMEQNLKLDGPYKGKPPMPDLSPEKVMRLQLDHLSADKQPVYLDLPATEYDLKETARCLKCEDLSGVCFISCQSIVPQIDSALSGCESIYALSDFAEQLYSMHWRGELAKYKAILELERPCELRDFVALAERLEQYQFEPQIVSPADFGEYELLELYKLDRSSPGMRHFDFAAFGRESMERGGVKVSPYGLIRRLDNGQMMTQKTDETPGMGIEMN